jgi:type IV pilus assembly protein PilW
MKQRRLCTRLLPQKLAHRQRGISLVEIMVALTISLLLTYGVGQIYLSSKQTYRLQEAQSRLQESARYALEFLDHDIRLAGYLGCNSGAVGTVPLTLTIVAAAPLVAPMIPPSLPASRTAAVCGAGNPALVTAAAVTGGDNNAGSFTCSSPALSATLNSPDLVQGTDAITIQFAESCSAGVFTNAAIASGADPTASATGSCDATGSPALLIAQCGGGTDSVDILRAGQVVSRAYAAASEIMTLRSYTYFIRTNPNNQPALYRFDNNISVGAVMKTVELVEGVEDMQITYGVDTVVNPDGGANQYLTATEVNALATSPNPWFDVVGVRVCLTIRSTDDYIASSPQPYLSCTTGAATTPADRRLRRTIQSTMSLRNSLANRPS